MTDDSSGVHFGVAAEDIVHPAHDLDPFFTCVRCLCLGTHHVEDGIFHCRVVDLGDGKTAEIRSMFDPPNGTPVVYRTCPFCGFKSRRIRKEAA